MKMFEFHIKFHMGLINNKSQSEYIYASPGNNELNDLIFKERWREEIQM